jgi:hypothetical protein
MGMGTAIRLTVLALAAGGVVATCALAVIKGQQGQPKSAETMYTLGVWEGQLAVFEGEDPYPAQLLDVAVAGLPKEEQQRLEQGLLVQTEQELYVLLEDYTS